MKGLCLSRLIRSSLFFSPLGRSLVSSLSATPAHPSVDNIEGPSTFSELYPLPAVVTESLRRQGLVYPTEIQRKSLEALLNNGQSDRRSCTVINAETGSGKTLCFLLPIIKLFESLWLKSEAIPAASAAILVPTPHLAQQVNDVFKSLADPNWNTCMAAFGHSTFSFTKNSHLLIAIPGKLQHYNLETLFSNNRMLCLDEADSLLYGGESVITRKILKFVQNQHRIHRKSHNGEDNYIVPRVILTAATLPSAGPQTVGKQLLRLFPRDSVTVIKTETTHKTLPNAEVKFVKCSNTESKFLQLVEDLDELCVSKDGNIANQDLPKVLVFVNTRESAISVSKFLCDPSLSSDGEFVKKWWLGRVGSFFKQPGVMKNEREVVLRHFREGSIRVMICSDLGSRGLDFPDCNAVIQFDFPENSEFFLHRAGRTARAGRRGKVISYVEESDVDVAKEIEKVVADRNKSFDSVFSRNKMLRRKIKRRQGKTNRQTYNEQDEQSAIE